MLMLLKTSNHQNTGQKSLHNLPHASFYTTSSIIFHHTPVEGFQIFPWCFIVLKYIHCIDRKIQILPGILSLLLSRRCSVKPESAIPNIQFHIR